MKRILVIAWREFVAAVCTKAFLIGILVMPFLISLTIFVPILLEKLEDTGERRIAVVDFTGVLIGPLEEAAAARVQDPEQRQSLVVERVDAGPLDPDPLARRTAFLLELDGRLAELGERVRKEEIFAFALLGPDLLDLEVPEGYFQAPAEESTAEHEAWVRAMSPWSITYGAESLTERGPREFLSGTLRTLIRDQRYQHAQVDAKLVARLNREARIQQLKVQEQAEAGGSGVVASDDDREVLLPIAFMVLLFMSVLSAAGPLLNNTIEEKSNRILEVLLSSSSPFQILTGKILGNYLMGLSISVLWASAGLAALIYHDKLPPGGIPLENLGFFLFFFLAGFLIYGCIYAAIGSTCTTVQDAQSMMMPLIILIMLPMLALEHVLTNPGSMGSQILSYFPFSSPFIMMLRLSLSPEPPLWQTALSMAILAGGVLVTLWASAKVFRIAILLYGKPPGFRELVRWLRS